MTDLQYLPGFVQIIIFVFLFILGTCIFSFLNVVIYRVPNHLNFVKGRSFCPRCHHSLAAKDLVPIFSWLTLRGRCRYCGQPISARYTWVELFGGIASCLCLAVYGLDPRWLIAFAVFGLGTVIALVDADTMEIPNGFVAAMLVIAVVSIWLFPEIILVERLIGAVVISVPMLLLSLIIPGAFGGGDIKLMVPAGFLLGWQLTLMAMFLAVLAGGTYGIYLLAGKKKGRKDHFAFGPFLCAGIAASLLWGGSLIGWYLGVLGF